ncbi:zinc-ribbon domain-containing protein [Virgibacillus sp. DJP39]|uniref:zinc-ribbon domain-containing protein n=1 Tax=Virgibacillus sp. DJP39 TaxID=3409790 RepID=UPI003BB72311
MYCTQCGSTIEKNARFCGGCGTSLASIIEDKGSKENNYQDYSIQTVNNNKGMIIENNEFLEQGNTVMKGFIRFVSESVKGPMKASRRVTEASLMSVAITHILFALTVSLLIYFMSKSFTDTFFLGLGEIPFIFVVVTLFFFTLIYLAVYTGIVFGIAKVMRAKTSYKQVLIRLGVFIVIPVVLLLFAILFYFISATTFSFALFGVGIGLFFVSSFLTIFSVMEDSSVGLDVYYGLILTIIAIAIILFILSDSVMGNLINQILEVLLN